MRIGILQAGHTAEALQPQHGDFDAMFARLLGGHGLTFEAFDVEHLVFPDGPDQCDGWLITGSRHGAYEDHAFIPPLETFIRDCVAAGRPMVGICFGHQIIAQALGGRVEKYAGGWAVGAHRYKTANGVLTLNAWHQDQVVDLPPGATPLGGSDHCANAIIAYGEKAWTIQPHPEFDSELIRDLVATRRGTGTYPDVLMDQAEQAANTGSPSDAPRIANAIAAFFKERAIYAAL